MIEQPAQVTASGYVTPHRVLHPYVGSVVGYAQDGLTPGVHHGLPSGWLTFVVTIGDPLRTASDRAAYQRGDLHTDAVVLGGLHTRSAYIEQPRRWAGIQLGVHPLAARALFGMPAAAIPTDRYAAIDLLGRDCARLHERLQETSDWGERFGVVEEFLLDRLVRAPRSAQPRPEVTAAWRAIRSTRGRCRVAEVSDAVGLGRRQLARVFAAETGITPKTLGRLTRFEAARTDLQQRVAYGERLDVAQVAHRHGYFDHAHLVRDFSDFADTTPTGWAAEVANVQASPGRESAQ